MYGVYTNFLSFWKPRQPQKRRRKNRTSGQIMDLDHLHDLDHPHGLGYLPAHPKPAVLRCVGICIYRVRIRPRNHVLSRQPSTS